MLNELDRAAATPADTGAARPPISKTLQIAESEREINGFRPGVDAHILPLGLRRSSQRLIQCLTW
jgi:hypothetical protein